MGFFDTVKEKANALASDAGRASKVTAAQARIVVLQNEVRKAERELGHAAFDLIERGELEPAGAAAAAARLREAHRALSDKEAEIAAIRAAAGDPQAAAGDAQAAAVDAGDDTTAVPSEPADETSGGESAGGGAGADTGGVAEAPAAKKPARKPAAKPAAAKPAAKKTGGAGKSGSAKTAAKRGGRHQDGEQGGEQAGERRRACAQEAAGIVHLSLPRPASGRSGSLAGTKENE